MNKTKLWGAAGVASLFLAGSLIRSPQSQVTGATYSSPVTVVNTTANPGSVLDANTATRVVYQSTQSAPDCSSGAACIFSFSPVPLGYRLVVQYVGGQIVAPAAANPTPPLGILSFNPAFGGSAAWFTYLLGSVGHQNKPDFAQNVTAYVDPGTPTLEVFTDNPGTGGNVTLTGYLQNCGVSPCPPQQN